MELVKNHKYLIREILSEIDVEHWQVLDVTKTSYNIKLENGKTFWITKQRFDIRHEIIEDLGSVVIASRELGRDIIDKIKKSIKEKQDKDISDTLPEKYPWEKKKPFDDFQKYIWKEKKDFTMQLTNQN